jgi:hypothetical protein
VGLLVDGDVLKVLSCAFWNNVLCSFRKIEEFGIMPRCLKCPHYLRFVREMDEDDERVMDEIDEIRANPDAYLRGGLR